MMVRWLTIYRLQSFERHAKKPDSGEFTLVVAIQTISLAGPPYGISSRV
jgi:preprotein translocase subunit Sss1